MQRRKGLASKLFYKQIPNLLVRGLGSFQPVLLGTAKKISDAYFFLGHKIPNTIAECYLLHQYLTRAQGQFTTDQIYVSQTVRLRTRKPNTYRGRRRFAVLPSRPSLDRKLTVCITKHLPN